MNISIIAGTDKADKTAVLNKLLAYNRIHFPKELQERYREANLYLKDDQGQVRGGLIAEVCYNWLEIHYLCIDVELRHTGYGKQLMEQVEQIAIQSQCDFIKVDTLTFQALEFYQKLGYVVYGELPNAGGFTHYYLKKDL